MNQPAGSHVDLPQTEMAVALKGPRIRGRREMQPFHDSPYSVHSFIYIPYSLAGPLKASDCFQESVHVL